MADVVRPIHSESVLTDGRGAGARPRVPGASDGLAASAGKNDSAVPFYVIVDDDQQSGEPDPDELKPLSSRVNRAGWRRSVAAECYDPEADLSSSDENDDNKTGSSGVSSRRPAKSLAQRERLVEAVKNILLFRSLDEELMASVIDAMFERVVRAGETVIRQGDSGDNFYVVESGKFDVYKKTHESAATTSETVDGHAHQDKCGQLGRRVQRLDDRGSFGELALMYNQPRAASVVAVTDGILWAMDRKSFRRIVLRSAFRKRQMYENMLSKVSVLRSLDDYERSTIADALRPQTYRDGDCIVRERDRQATGMYIIEQGAARVTVTKQGVEETVALLGVGDYFGEYALLYDLPRTASVYAAAAAGNGCQGKCDATSAAGAGLASDKVRVAFLERDSFERLLGPCLDIMRRKTHSYTYSASDDDGQDDGIFFRAASAPALTTIVNDSDDDDDQIFNGDCSSQTVVFRH